MTSLLFPAYARIANPFALLAIGEILIILWLAFMGTRTTPWELIRTTSLRLRPVAIGRGSSVALDGT